MAWIKKNPHLLTLIIVAIGVAAASTMVVLNSQSFNQQFTDPIQDHPQASKIPALDVSVIDRAQAELTNPVKWAGIPDPDPDNRGTVILPFVPKLYTIVDDKPVSPKNTSHHNDRLTGQPIPDRWFIEHGLPVTDINVGKLDSDGDGFPNDEEWRVQTDPQKKDSHAAYYTELYLKQVIRQPFRLRFNAYDGDPDKPDTMTFQINTLDLRQPSEFLKIGDTINKTKYKIVKFQLKTAVNPKTESEEDVSLLTLMNVETNVPVDLIYRKIVDSPDVYAVFTNYWNTSLGEGPQKPQDFTVKNKGKFIVLPEKELFYELLDIKDDHGLIKLPSGEEKVIPLVPASLRR